MEVWVRSQDKNGFFQIGGVQYYCIEKEHHLYCTLKSNSITREDLGQYPTKERCLEIIDEIQKLLCQTFMIFRNLDIPEDIAEYLKPKKGIVYQAENQTPSIEYHDQSVVVYEMPKE